MNHLPYPYFQATIVTWTIIFKDHKHKQKYKEFPLNWVSLHNKEKDKFYLEKLNLQNKNFIFYFNSTKLIKIVIKLLKRYYVQFLLTKKKNKYQQVSHKSLLFYFRYFFALHNKYISYKVQNSIFIEKK